MKNIRAIPIYRERTGNSGTEGKFKDQFMKNSTNEITHTYHIGGMSCGGCVKTVEHKLSTLPDVASVKVNLGKQQVEITSSQLLTINELQKGLDNTNYTLTELRA